MEGPHHIEHLGLRHSVGEFKFQEQMPQTFSDRPITDLAEKSFSNPGDSRYSPNARGEVTIADISNKVEIGRTR